jgi:hypothetical protein
LNSWALDFAREYSENTVISNRPLMRELNRNTGTLYFVDFDRIRSARFTPRGTALRCLLSKIVCFLPKSVVLLHTVLAQAVA